MCLSRRSCAKRDGAAAVFIVAAMLADSKQPSDPHRSVITCKSPVVVERYSLQDRLGFIQRVFVMANLVFVVCVCDVQGMLREYSCE